MSDDKYDDYEIFESRVVGNLVGMKCFENDPEECFAITKAHRGV